MTLTCDMVRDCENPITHIGEKGYVYCAGHVGRRSGVERCRKITRAEMATLLSGGTIARY
jgi:hypothetical protein